MCNDEAGYAPFSFDASSFLLSLFFPPLWLGFWKAKGSGLTELGEGFKLFGWSWGFGRPMRFWVLMALNLLRVFLLDECSMEADLGTLLVRFYLRWRFG